MTCGVFFLQSCYLDNNVKVDTKFFAAYKNEAFTVITCRLIGCLNQYVGYVLVLGSILQSGYGPDCCRKTIGYYNDE